VTIFLVGSLVHIQFRLEQFELLAQSAVAFAQAIPELSKEFDNPIGC
jgi:hypothetical protein